MPLQQQPLSDYRKGYTRAHSDGTPTLVFGDAVLRAGKRLFLR
jgi:hypothetical protein